MKVVALYKTFRGHEFVEASIESIYDSVVKVVMVNSEVGWNGQEGNTVREPVQKWQHEHDDEGKIVHINGRYRSQEEQYRVGIDHIKNNHVEYDIIMLIDTDEVWEYTDLMDALRFITTKKRSRAYAVWMHTYVKTPFFKVWPAWGMPVAFVRDPEAILEGARAEQCQDKQLIKNVYFHHFPVVREDTREIAAKIDASFLGDGKPGGKAPDALRWTNEVWDRMPNVENFHYFPGCESCWQKVQPVWIDDLPYELRDKPIIETFMPAGRMSGEESDVLFHLSQDRKLCVDLGTLKGRSAAIMALSGARVVTIDDYSDPEADKAIVERHLRWYHNIEIFHGKTSMPLASTTDVDFLFVDAGHDYDSVRADLRAWLPTMEEGGLVVLHDNCYKYLGVKKMVRELEKDEKLVRIPEEECGSLAVFGVCR